MLTANTEILVTLSEDLPAPILRRALVVESGPDALVISFAEPVRPVVGTSAYVYYSIDQKRLRSPARIQDSIRAKGTRVVRLVEIGEPEPCEVRKSVRILTAGEQKVDLEQHSGELDDTSFEGFAALLSGTFKIGSVLSVVLFHEEQEFRGRAYVRNAARIENGRTRYGFEVLESEVELRQGLHRITMQNQRMQLFQRKDGRKPWRTSSVQV